MGFSLLSFFKSSMTEKKGGTFKGDWGVAGLPLITETNGYFQKWNFCWLKNREAGFAYKKRRFEMGIWLFADWKTEEYGYV